MAVSMGFRKAARRLIAAGLGAAMIGGAAPAMAETLADALVAAYRESNLLDQNRAVLRAADEDAAQAVAALRPVLGFIADTGYAKTVTGEGDSTSLSLVASLTLWDNGRTRLGIAIAREAVMATREALVGVEQQVLLEAVRAYFDVRSAQEFVGINENSVRVIGEELRAAQDRFEVGEVTRTDVAQAEASLAGARAALSAAQGDLTVAREAYKAATGHYPVNLAPPPPLPTLPRTLDDAKSIALRSYPAMLQAQREVTVTELQVQLAAANRGPSLDASGKVSRYLHEHDFADDTYSVGIELNQTLYAGGALSSAHRQAVANRDAARAALLQQGVTISNAVGQAWSAFDVARAQIGATDEQIAAAAEAYRGVREEASLGARTTLDVLDAEQTLLDAKAARIDAEATLQVANYSLLAAMGLLTADRLNLGIPTYDPAAYYEAVKNAPATSVQGRSLDRVLRAIGKN